MTLILGISAYYHDSAVALLRDGEIVAAASEERFTRKKHDAAFPAQALQACLEMAGAGVADIDYVGFYEKPLLKFDRLLETYLAYAPRGYRSFAAAMPSWLQTKLHLPREIRKQLKGQYKRRIVFCEHHQSHAASAFFPSPFERAAVLTIDGVGEWTTTSWGAGEHNQLHLRQDVHFPHSLGLLYSAFTYFCGFRVNSGEYKLMGLAPYGQPKYADLIREKLVRVHADGSYELNMAYFAYCHSLRMTGRKLEALLGVPRRAAESPIRDVDMDLAASIQVVTEEIVLAMTMYVHQRTQLDSLCMAGGVALNCVANGRLLREGPFKNIWVQPAAGDAGGALGVAWFIWHQLMNKPRTVHGTATITHSSSQESSRSDVDMQLQSGAEDLQRGSLLGPAVDFDHDLKRLAEQDATFQTFASPAELDRTVAQLLADGHVVGWVQGGMEFGPRALGNRSILGDPRNTEMQTTMNLKIKFRESFRPFAPAVLEECASQYFQMHGQASSPYMLFTHFVQDDHRRPNSNLPSAAPETASRLARVREVRSSLPAITHMDYSARVQTVSTQRHPRFHSLLNAFYQLTGCPALINTSFNVRGEPIVGTAADAYRCFMATHMDALVVGDALFLRNEQPATAELASQQYLSQLEPD